jgi:hypothetical protein
LLLLYTRRQNRTSTDARVVGRCRLAARHRYV